MAARRRGLAAIGCACVSTFLLACTSSAPVSPVKPARLGQTLDLRGGFGEAAVTIIGVRDPAVPTAGTAPAEAGAHYIGVEERVSSLSRLQNEEIGLETWVDTPTLTQLSRVSATNAIEGCPSLPEFATLTKTSQPIIGCLAIQVPNGGRVVSVTMQMYEGAEGKWSVP